MNFGTHPLMSDLIESLTGILTTSTSCYAETDMIHASIRMTMPSQKHSEVLDLLISFSQKTRDEPGCVSCLVYCGTGEEGGILLDEFWSDEAFLELHLRSSQFQKVLQISELSSAPPEFRFDTILRSSGVETIVKARGPTGI